MIANKILSIILLILSLVVIPIQIVSTFVLGLLVQLSFGLLLFPITLMWWMLYFPILGLSYIYEKIYFFRIPVCIIGIPIATAASIYVSIMPSMGDWENRISKLFFADFFPYTWHVLRYSIPDPFIRYSRGYNNLKNLLDQAYREGRKRSDYAIELKAKFNLACRVGA